MRTKAFKDGNSQAVRIPAEIAYESTDIELEIVRIGDRIIIEPVAQSPGEVIRKMNALPDFMPEGRGDEEQKERDSLKRLSLALRGLMFSADGQGRTQVTYLPDETRLERTGIERSTQLTPNELPPVHARHIVTAVKHRQIQTDSDRRSLKASYGGKQRSANKFGMPSLMM